MGTECKLLNIFRFWRLIRLYIAMISIEKEAHSKTLSELSLSKTIELQLRNDINRLDDEILKEKVRMFFIYMYIYNRLFFIYSIYTPLL